MEVAPARPKVSFVVPCYRLGHFLRECVESILSQTYGNFEVLIMDDCSPDDTMLVAQSFDDLRVRYIRNELTLGHGANFNKGISLTRGEYVWLISADDRLRRQYVLDRYVAVMDGNPAVGYACCAGMELEGGWERLADYSLVAEQDTIFNGRDFLLNTHMLSGNAIIASSGMTRKACYERLGAFPEDLPYGEDWYLWCLLALHYDVAYFAEPMVTYRLHALSMSNQLRRTDARIMVEARLAVLSRIKHRAEEAALPAVTARCRMSLVNEYLRCAAPGGSTHYLQYEMGVDEMNESISGVARDRPEARRIRARVYVLIGDRHFDGREFAEADGAYARACREHPLMWSVWAKRLLLRMGRFGLRIRALRRRHCDPRPSPPRQV